MLAVLADPDSPAGCRATEVAEPVARPGQAVVEAHYVAVNRGDLDDVRAGRLHPGAIVGRDVAGVIVRAARPANGLPVGTRVVASAAGAFAKRVPVDVEALVPVPDGVDLAEAAALPTAGVAAIQALRCGNLETRVKGARVLVTGATGGVGRFAVQLAAYGGAEVIAATRRDDLVPELLKLGADQVVTRLDEVDEPVDLVLDTVGGRQLVAAWDLLVAGGSVQCIGGASGEPAAFAAYALTGSAKTLNSFALSTPVGPDLAALLGLVEQGHLRVVIHRYGSLAQIGDVARDLLARRLTGKVVLDVGPRRRASRQV